MTNVVVAGSETIDEYQPVKQAIWESPWFSARGHWPPEMWGYEIVHGGADGVDSQASTFAEEYDFEETVFEPDLDAHGKAAVSIRNRKMAAHGDVLVAVWDGESSETRDLIEQALDKGLAVYVAVVDDD